MLGLPFGKVPKTPGPPNQLNYYILGLGGLGDHLGESDLFVYRGEYAEHWRSQKSQDPGPPQTILIVIFWDLVVWIIIWEN